MTLEWGGRGEHRSVHYKLEVEHLCLLTRALEEYYRPVERHSLEGYMDLCLGGVDASLVVLVERLNVTQIATLDRRNFVVRPRQIALSTPLTLSTHGSG